MNAVLGCVACSLLTPVAVICVPSFLADTQSRVLTVGVIWVVLQVTQKTAMMMSTATCKKGSCFTASTSAPQPHKSAPAARLILCHARPETSHSPADSTPENPLSRRAVVSASLASAALVLLTDAPAYAVQGYTAGRIPGSCPVSACCMLPYTQDRQILLSALHCNLEVTAVIRVLLPDTGLTKSLDADGFYTYTRPEGKQGGHGVGWSELPRYAFKVPPGWTETAVSIADLGGTEVDFCCIILFGCVACTIGLHTCCIRCHMHVTRSNSQVDGD